MRHSIPKKSLGQNFLIDDNVVRKIINTFSPSPDELVVEIGPGEGALTHYLDALGVETIAYEIDQDMVAFLKNKFRDTEVITFKNKDILESDFERIAADHDKPIRVLGNIPYNITSPIIFHLIHYRQFIQDALLMTQKEVAERMAAEPDSKKYGILSVLLQTYAEVTYEFTVSRNVFRPRPQVSSGMVSLRWHEKWSQHIPDVDLYRIVVRTAFGKRRKTLRNSLDYLPMDFDVDKLEFDTGLRAEQLNIRDFIKLTREIGEKYPNYKDEIIHSEI